MLAATRILDRAALRREPPKQAQIPCFSINNSSRTLAQQLTIVGGDSHVEQEVFRLAAMRAFRAAILAACNWFGMALAVPKYISSGVWP